jgi:hypothetical protein
LLFAGRNGFLDNLSIEQIREFKSTVRDIFEDEESALAFVNLYELDDEIVRDLTLEFVIEQLTETIKSE